MHILCLHQHFASGEGIGSTRSYELSRFLRTQGHQITIVCGRSDRSGLPPKMGKMVDEYSIDGIRVLALQVPYRQNMIYIRRLYSFIWFMLLASGVALRQRHVDIIFAISTPLTIGVPAMVVSLLKRIPFIFEVRDLWPEVPIGLGILENRVLIVLAHLLERITYQRAKHIVALSPGMKDAIIRQGISPDKVTVIPSWCDIELFDIPPGAGEKFRSLHPQFANRPLVLYSGAFGFANDLSYFIHLAACVYRLDPQVVFLMIGDGAETKRLGALAEQLGVLGQNLWMFSPVPKKQIPSILSAATVATSIFINNPVMWPNSANKFFDTLAAGKPIVINYEGWQADVIRETSAGLVMNATDTTKAAAQLVEALHDTDWLACAGKAAKQLADTHFSKERLAGMLKQVLLDAAQ